MLKKLLGKASGRKSRTVYEDEYLTWLRFANPGMLHGGNVFAMKHAIERLPTDDPIVEIGSFCGLSTNAMTYFLRITNKPNAMFCSDRWIFENSESGKTIGASNISHDEYREFVKESFKRNISMFSPNRPYPIELFSDEFFAKWKVAEDVEDVFGRPVRLGGKISFCYIDGNHTYDFAKRDFENTHEHLVSGGFILFDDSADTDPFGLTRLMNEVSRRPDYKLVMKNPNYLFQKI